MKINTGSISFYESQKIYRTQNGTVKEVFDDENFLVRREKSDIFVRDTDTIWYDKNGNIIEEMHKNYFKTPDEEGCIETFKSKTQEYTRKAYTKFENGFKHVIDSYNSKTGKNYFNDFIHDLSGKLLKIITNGKIIEL